MINYQIKDASFIISDTVSDQVLWQGRPYDCPVTKILPLSALKGCIVLLDYYQFSKSEYRANGNLLFLNSAGEIKWTAETPTSSDSYVDFHKEGGKIHATSWDGYFVEIDPTNGKILSKILGQ